MQHAYNRRPHTSFGSYNSHRNSYARLIAEKPTTTEAPEDEEIPPEVGSCLAELFTGLPDYSAYVFCKAHFGKNWKKYNPNRLDVTQLNALYGRMNVRPDEWSQGGPPLDMGEPEYGDQFESEWKQIHVKYNG